jgi:hypothetical protein
MARPDRALCRTPDRPAPAPVPVPVVLVAPALAVETLGLVTLGLAPFPLEVEPFASLDPEC